MDPSNFSRIQQYSTKVQHFMNDDYDKEKAIKEKYTTGDKHTIVKLTTAEKWQKAKEIAETAEDILGGLAKAPTKGKATELLKIRTNLEQVKEKALSQHWWLTQLFIISFKGFRSEEQNKVFEEISNIKDQENLALQEQAVIWNKGTLEEQNAVNAETNLQTDATTKAREGYFRVVGKKEMPSEKLEGSTFSLSLMSIRKDIDQYKKDFGTNFPQKQQSALESAGKKLEFAEKLSRRIEIVSTGTSTTQNDKRLSDIVFDIQDKIVSLKKGEEMLIPGGYLQGKEGHAVIYSIKRQDKGQLSFTIHNTGDGSDKAINPWGMIINSLLTIINKAQDTTIINIDETQLLNPEFLTKLIQQRTREKTTNNDNETHSMTQIFKLVEVNLCKGNSKATTGLAHPCQVNGTCTHDSVTCWLQSSFSKEEGSKEEGLFDELDSYMIGSGMRYLTSLGNDRSYAVYVKRGKERQTEKLEKITTQFAEVQKELSELREQQLKVDPKKLEDHIIKLKHRIRKLSKDEIPKETTFKSLFTTSEYQTQCQKVKKLEEKLQKLKSKWEKPKEELQKQLDKIKKDVLNKKTEVQEVAKQKAYLERLLEVPVVEPSKK